MNRLLKLKELIQLATNEGLLLSQANLFAQNNLNSSNDIAQSNLENLVINNAKGITAGQYSDGLSQHQYGTSSSSSSSCVNGYCRNLVETITSGKAIYNQHYSIITADTKSGTRNYSTVNELDNINIKGLKTKIDSMPTEGTASYNGKAFDAVNSGLLSYQVNFTDKTGYGTITGLGNDIELEKGSISGTGISSTAIQSYKSGEYSLSFFGKNAEEISGKVSLDGNDVAGFGGTRGEIQK